MLKYTYIFPLHYLTIIYFKPLQEQRTWDKYEIHAIIYNEMCHVL